MTGTYDGSFSTFVDHYVLLMAARFEAPLELSHSELDDSVAEVSSRSSAAAASEESWRLVSECVQTMLRAPRTAEERAYLKHVEASFFTPAVCRERALYLQWRSHKAHEDRRLARKAAKARPVADATAGTPSTFDITHNSIKLDISAIFADVRRALPSALLDSDTDEDNDGASEGEERTPRARQPAMAVQEVFMRTEDEVRRDAEVARARDVFLSKVQEMQAEFFAKHRRWVDVPEAVLDMPPVSGGRTPSVGKASGNGNISNHTGEAERVTLLAMLREASPEDGANSLNALKKSVHVNRPARPSEVSDDTIEALYRNAGMAAGSAAGVMAAPYALSKATHLPNGSSSHLDGSGNGVRKTGVVATGDGGAAAAARTGIISSAPVAAATTVTVAASKTETKAAPIKETTPPAGRHARWQIVEYNDDGAGDSSDDE